jgi:S-adenosylmethionine:tRNA ribosyltransferase-isomerase
MCPPPRSVSWQNELVTSAEHEPSVAGEDLEQTAAYDYHLPPELIAQAGVEPRDAARMLVLHRATGRFEHRQVHDLPEYVRPGDALFFNDSRVLPARLRGRKPTGGAVEVLLLRRRAPGEWEALVRPGQRLRAGATILLDGEVAATVLETLTHGGRLIRLEGEPAEAETRALARGEAPLPPYIQSPLADPERYQTVYAREAGSAAAPTAGLHFTPELLSRLQEAGAAFGYVTLHVGLGTFRPIAADRLANHEMHEEWYHVPPATAELANQTEGRRLLVGTTTVRVLESAATEDGEVRAGGGWTRLFLRPGSRFRVTDALLTNFHLPRSSLLVLVSAFAGRELILAAYEEAIRRCYRFYSLGDAMLIL